MKYFFRSLTISIVAIGCLSACDSDRTRSEQLFKKYCNEEGRIGQFIYERVDLGEEYFRAIPTDEKELRSVDNSYYLYIDGIKLLIDKNRFKQSYIVNYWKKKMLSPIGPIYTIQSSIIRKSDGKTLSKSVSLLNMLDKKSKYFSVEGVTCPTGRDIKGTSLSNKHHFNLIEKTFTVNK